MCGIYCCIVQGTLPKRQDGTEENPTMFCRFSEALKRRGPDCSHRIAVQLNGKYWGFFSGDVLWLQGQRPVAQPIQDSAGNILLWNGDIFDGVEVPHGASDSDILSQVLSECNSDVEVLDTFSRIQGPWAFIYWQAAAQKLWFGRDVFGRHSLLWTDIFIDNFFALSSVAKKSSYIQKSGDLGEEKAVFSEVPSVGVYAVDIRELSGMQEYKIKVYPWEHLHEHIKSTLVRENISVQFWPKLISPLKVILNRTLPCEADLFHYDAVGNDDPYLLMEHLLSQVLPLEVQMLLDVLGDAVRTRVHYHPKLCKECVKKVVNSSCNEYSYNNFKESLVGSVTSKCSHSKIAILFSGGLDSAVLAALVNLHVPSEEPIDLLNVAFEQERKTENDKHTKINKAAKQVKPSISDYNVPDRCSGKQALEELIFIDPVRKWNFVEINVTKEELVKAREEKIADLVFPLRTVLDDSIGCAVWFAAHGSGIIRRQNGEEENYTSPSRVMLVGMGADEQLAGYSRHRSQFTRSNWQGLLQEIQMEVQRISERNLGRDNRIIADHGCEARFPFLDEKLVSFLNSLPMWQKANLNLPRGVGEKLLLRLAAYKLGLKRTSVLPKRAIQFGSRIAKLENRKEKADELCDRL